MEKLAFCRREYLNRFLSSEAPLICGKTDCWGAHHSSALIVLPHLKKWDSINWNTINLAEWEMKLLQVMYYGMKDITIYPPGIIKRVNYNEFEALPFLEKLKVWRNYAQFFRKYAKSVPSRKKWFGADRPQSIFGNLFYEEIPQFHVEEYEDDFWNFERRLCVCQEQETFFTSIINGTNKYELQAFVCPHNNNCKNYIHDYSQLICEEDFYTGKCSCSKDTIDNTNHVKIKSIKVSQNYLKNKNERKFRIEHAPEDCRKELINIRSCLVFLEKNKLKLHLTHIGLKPYNSQIKEKLTFNDPTIKDSNIIENTATDTHTVSDKAKTLAVKNNKFFKK